MKLIIGFGKPKSGFVPLAWAIELIEKVGYSHTYFKWADAAGVDQIFETVLSGTKQVTATDFLAGYSVVEEYAFELSDADAKVYQNFVTKYNGVPYSYEKLFGVEVAKIFNLNTNPFSNDDKSLICTHTLMLLIEALPNVFVGAESIKLSPSAVGLKTLHDFIVSNKNATRVVA